VLAGTEVPGGVEVLVVLARFVGKLARIYLTCEHFALLLFIN
jgi:hypothetical protein